MERIMTDKSNEKRLNQKLKKLKNGSMFVKTKFSNGKLTLNGREVQRKEWEWSINRLCNFFAVSRNWVFQHIQPHCHYIYIGSYRPIREAFGVQYDDGLSTVFFNSRDIFNWFKNNWVVGHKTRRVKINDFFNNEDIEKMLNLSADYLITGESYGLFYYFREHGSNKIVTDNALVNQTVKIFDYGRQFPFIEDESLNGLSYEEFSSYNFLSQKSYKYRSLGNRNMLINASKIYYFSNGAKRPKLLFRYDDENLNQFDGKQLDVIAKREYKLIKEQSSKNRKLREIKGKDIQNFWNDAAIISAEKFHMI